MRTARDLPRGLEEIGVTRNEVSIDLTHGALAGERHEFVISGTDVHVLLSGEHGVHTRAVLATENSCVLFDGQDRIYIIDLPNNRNTPINFPWVDFAIEGDVVVVIGVGQVLSVESGRTRIFELPVPIDVVGYRLVDRNLLLDDGQGGELAIDLDGPSIFAVDRRKSL